VSFYEHRRRFPQVSKLAKESLKGRGFKVRTLRVFENRKGIWVKWDIADPSKPNLLEKLSLKQSSPKYLRSYGQNGYRFEGEEACNYKNDAACRVDEFFGNLRDAFNRLQII